MRGSLAKYFDLSAKLGGDIAAHVSNHSNRSGHTIHVLYRSLFQANLVKSAFQVQRSFISSAGVHKTPPPVSDESYNIWSVLLIKPVCLYRMY